MKIFLSVLALALAIAVTFEQIRISGLEAQLEIERQKPTPAPIKPGSIILPDADTADAREVVYLNNGIYVRTWTGSNYFYSLTNLDYFQFPTNQL